MSDLDDDWFVPGSEFLAKSLLAGSIAVFNPPGIGAIEVEQFSTMSCMAHEIEDEFDRYPKPNGPGVGVMEELSRQMSSEVIQIRKHLNAMMENAKMPESWIEEGVEEPTNNCKYYTLNLLNRLSIEFGLIPYKVAMSKDGGMFAAYRRADSSNIMRVEIGNELDAVAVVSDGSKILDSGILESDDLEKGIVDAFNGSTPLAIEM